MHIRNLNLKRTGDNMKVLWNNDGVEFLKKFKPRLVVAPLAVQKMDLFWDIVEYIGYPEVFLVSECTEDNFSKVYNFKEKVAAFGGGKAIDTGKAALYAGFDFVSIPTTLTCCAAASNHTVINNPDGSYKRTLPKTHYPNAVIIIKEFFENLPRQQITAGVADAVAKYFEMKIGVTWLNSISLYKKDAKKLESNYSSMVAKAQNILSYFARKKGPLHITDNMIKKCVIEPAFGFVTVAHAIADALAHFYPLSLHGNRVSLGIEIMIDWAIKNKLANVQLKRRWETIAQKYSLPRLLREIAFEHVHNTNSSYVSVHPLAKKQKNFSFEEFVNKLFDPNSTFPQIKELKTSFKQFVFFKEN